MTRLPSIILHRFLGPAIAVAAGLAGAAGAILPTPAPLAAQDTLAIGELREALEDSAYSTPGLRRFVSRAAQENSRLPDLLSSYQVRVESEISILQAEPDGNEVTLQIEQVASDVLWRRDQPTVQEVVGYRARSAGFAPSVLTMFEVPWVVPTLYGDRIDLVRWNVPSVDEEGRVLRRRAMHPLGPDRNRIYRFTGGDTILTLGLPDRTLRLVRVEVEPVHAPDLPTLLFEGHMDIDADRHQIVRMRGRMISARPEESGGDRLLGAIASGVTFVEFESSEVDQRFWLPRYQRIEVQAISRLVDTRVALRLVSRFDFPERLNEPGPLATRHPDPPDGGVLVVDEAVRERTFGDWDASLGDLTGEANALDFRDLEPGQGPDRTGPQLRLGVRHLSQLVRYNEPEGLFTGIGVTLHPGGAWKEGRIRAHAGWAWSEATARGGLEVSHLQEEGRWEWLARAERQLRNTGDFGPAYVRERGVPPLVAGEDELFYDHWTAGLVARQPRGAGWAWRLEAARAEDRRIELPDVDTADPVVVASVEEGTYWLGRVTLERNPEATGYGVAPGVALRLDAEGGTGDLEWIRLEAGVSARRMWDPFSLEGRLDGGITLSDAPPPQRLFELGRYHGLPGYPPRAFAGDRAALGQAAVSYTLPFLRRPFAVGGFFLPAPAPAPTVILRAGWTDASDDALPVMTELGARTTDGLRSTLDLRLRFFGGGVSVGAARPLDSGGRWRFVWSLAREF